MFPKAERGRHREDPLFEYMFVKFDTETPKLAEKTVNQYARQGWVVVGFSDGYVLLEHEIIEYSQTQRSAHER